MDIVDYLREAASVPDGPGVDNCFAKTAKLIEAAVEIEQHRKAAKLQAAVIDSLLAELKDAKTLSGAIASGPSFAEIKQTAKQVGSE